MRATYPTGHPDVDALLGALLSGIQAALGSDLVGLYLHGSLALGDFDPARSDIDFVAVTSGELAQEAESALAAMHARIAASDLRWTANYEGSYIPQGAIRRYDPGCCVHPAIRVDGGFGLEHHGPDWVILRHILREHGVVLAGPPPAALIDPVSADDLRQAVWGSLREWWAPKLDDPSGLPAGEYQAYTVLTMCRMLYTLQTGAIATKPQAARWAKATLGADWGGLIDGAMAWHHGVDFDQLDEVLAFMRFGLARANTLHRNGFPGQEGSEWSRRSASRSGL